MIAQPSPEAVELVAAALRTEGVLSIAVWQGIDYAVEQQQNDAKSEALFQYIAALEADRALLDAVVNGEFTVTPMRADRCGVVRTTPSWCVQFAGGSITHVLLRSAIGWAIAATTKKQVAA